MGVVALLATSCNKKDETTAKTYRGGSYDERFEQENANGFEERAYIDNVYRMTFEEGDQVMLFNVDDETPANSEAALYVTTAGYEPVFEPYQADNTISDEMMSAKYAYYPGIHVQTEALENENRSVFKLLPQQEYREVNGAPVVAKEALYMAAKLDNPASDYFAFRNICGVLVMKFYSPAGKTIESIKITDNAVTLTGDVTLKVNEVDPAQMMELFRNYDPSNAEYVAALNEYKNQVGYAVDQSGNELTLVCNDGVQLGTTATEANTFYFVLRPLALMNGFDMVITFNDTTTKTISTVRNNMIKPNTLRVFPALNVD